MKVDLTVSTKPVIVASSIPVCSCSKVVSFSGWVKASKSLLGSAKELVRLAMMAGSIFMALSVLLRLGSSSPSIANPLLRISSLAGAT